MSGDRQAVVLVLDDDPNVGDFVRATLPEKTYRVLWHRTSEDAIRAAAEEPPDVAVVGIGLSADGSGFDFLKHLRAQSDTERVPVVMLTGSPPPPHPPRPAPRPARPGFPLPKPPPRQGPPGALPVLLPPGPPPPPPPPPPGGGGRA